MFKANRNNGILIIVGSIFILIFMLLSIDWYRDIPAMTNMSAGVLYIFEFNCRPNAAFDNCEEIKLHFKYMVLVPMVLAIWGIYLVLYKK